MLDVTSFRRYRRLRWPYRRRGLSAPVAVRPRALQGHEVLLRPGTSDAQVFEEIFAGAHHLPPSRLSPKDPRLVFDLGSNIGLTMAHMAVVFPRARIVGVELDRDNVLLSQENIRPWSNRCEVIEGAVWHTDGTVAYELQRGSEWTAHITGSSEASTVVRAFSLNTLLADRGAVDYVKLDIEGAELEVLRQNTQWTRQVSCIKVEVHEPYTTAECAADLERVGFATWVGPGANVVGVRTVAS
jgi:FkbM family methyltransferase